MTDQTAETAPAERPDALMGRAGARGAGKTKPARTKRTRERRDLYQDVTDRIIGELEQGRAPWVQPWGRADVSAPLGLPKNGATERTYSGINILLLWGAAIEGGRSGQTWLTFKQALSLGGCVRKGERGTKIVYADRFTPKAEKERTVLLYTDKPTDAALHNGFSGRGAPSTGTERATARANTLARAGYGAALPVYTLL